MSPSISIQNDSSIKRVRQRIVSNQLVSQQNNKLYHQAAKLHVANIPALKTAQRSQPAVASTIES